MHCLSPRESRKFYAHPQTLIELGWVLLRKEIPILSDVLWSLLLRIARAGKLKYKMPMDCL